MTRKRLFQFLTLLPLLARPAFAQFGGSVTLSYYFPGAVPTLGTAMLVLLALLLPLLAVRLLRRLPGGRIVAVVLALVALDVISSVTGRLFATAVTPIHITTTTAQNNANFPLFSLGAGMQLFNDTGLSMVLTQIQFYDSGNNPIASTGTCQVNVPLPPSTSCGRSTF